MKLNKKLLTIALLVSVTNSSFAAKPYNGGVYSLANFSFGLFVKFGVPITGAVFSCDDALYSGGLAGFRANAYRVNYISNISPISTNATYMTVRRLTNTVKVLPTVSLVSAPYPGSIYTTNSAGIAVPTYPSNYTVQTLLTPAPGINNYEVKFNTNNTSTSATSVTGLKGECLDSYGRVYNPVLVSYL
jgi:hypothetical protein